MSRFALTGCLLACLALAAPAESVRFRFAPEPGSHWLRSGEDRLLRDVGTAAPISETVTRQEVEIRIESLPDGGWRVVQIPRAASLEVDGAPTENLALDLTVGVEIELTLGADGLTQRVRGFRELLRRLEDELPASHYARVTQSMSETSLAAQEKSRWDGQLGQLLDATVSVGERWHVTELRSFAMSNAEPVEGVMHFAGWTEMDGLRGFKIEYEYDNRGDVVRKSGGDGLRKVDWRPGGASSQKGNVWIRGKELRVLIPETGQLLYRTIEQTAELTPMEGVDISKVGTMQGRFEEQSVYRWRPIPGQGE
jgi:hypothetical protein